MRLHGDRVQPLVADSSAEGSRPGVAWLQRCIPAEAVVRAAGRTRVNLPAVGRIGHPALLSSHHGF